MMTYSLDGLEESLFDEHDWSDSIKEENEKEWAEYDKDNEYDALDE